MIVSLHVGTRNKTRVLQVVGAVNCLTDLFSQPFVNFCSIDATFITIFKIYKVINKKELSGMLRTGCVAGTCFTC